MRDARWEWSEALVTAAEKAGVWDESASMDKRTTALGALIGYSGRQVQRWVTQQVNPPDADERRRLLHMIAPSAPQSAANARHMSDRSPTPQFNSEAERVGFLKKVLFDAERAIQEARAALEQPIPATPLVPDLAQLQAVTQAPALLESRPPVRRRRTK